MCLIITTSMVFLFGIFLSVILNLSLDFQMKHGVVAVTFNILKGKIWIFLVHNIQIFFFIFLFLHRK